jgi:DNA-binding IscR family transcriptional regulator
MSDEMFAAMQILRDDDLTRRTFELVRQSSGTVSGWDLARALGITPDATSAILQKLKAANIVKSSGEGLEGYYYLTDLGFRIQLMRAA